MPQCPFLIANSGGYVKIGGVFLGSKADAVKAFTDAGLYKALGQPKSNVRCRPDSTIVWVEEPAMVEILCMQTAPASLLV